jgi:hypothetical protein
MPALPHAAARGACTLRAELEPAVGFPYARLALAAPTRVTPAPVDSVVRHTVRTGVPRVFPKAVLACAHVGFGSRGSLALGHMLRAPDHWSHLVLRTKVFEGRAAGCVLDDPRDDADDSR